MKNIQVRNEVRGRGKDRGPWNTQKMVGATKCKKGTISKQKQEPVSGGNQKKEREEMWLRMFDQKLVKDKPVGTQGNPEKIKIGVGKKKCGRGKGKTDRALDPSAVKAAPFVRKGGLGK